MSDLGMVLKEIHLGYSTRFLFGEYDLYLEVWSWWPYWYVRKKPSEVDIWGYVNACILLFLFIIQILKFFTLFIFHYFLSIFMFPFCLHATSALCKPITIFFCIIKRFWIFDVFEIFICFIDLNKNKFYYNVWSYLIVKRV